MKDKTLVIIETLIVAALLIGIVVYAQVLWSKYRAQQPVVEAPAAAVEDPEYPVITDDSNISPEDRYRSLELLESDVEPSTASPAERAASLEALETEAVIME